MIWLLNSPRTIQRIIAVAVLCAALIIAVAIVINVHAALANARTSVFEQRFLLGRLQSSISELAGIRVESTRPIAAGSIEFLPGPNEDVIRAQLQQGFKEAAARHGVDLVSVGNAPNLVNNDVTYVGLQANITGKIASLQRFLLALETATPMLFIPQLTIRAPGSQNRAAQQVEPMLVAQLRIYGALRPLNEIRAHSGFSE